MSYSKKRGRQLLDFENDRDATLKLIDWFDINRIRAARVLVVGAGAIGNEVLKNLALLGVGNIFIIDRDTVEMSNLSRSILYRASDRGKPKASAAARAVRDINPNVKVRCHTGDIRTDLGLGLLRRMDVVIGCLDNREARLYINRACWKVGRPWVDAGIGQLNGQARVFHPAYGACYECSFSEADFQQIQVPCNLLDSKYLSENKIPTTPTIASIVAAVQVQEALKLLDPDRWDGRTLAGREFIYNGTIGEASVVELPMREDCLAHSAIDPGLLIELKDTSSQKTSLSALIAIAREVLGPAAVLDLNFELAVEKRCRGCRDAVRVLRPESKLFIEELKCEECGRARHIVNTHTLGSLQNAYEEDFLHLPLGAIGIPPLDILEARGVNGDKRYLELSGDSREFLDFG
jgi:molybdopterin/thiamine biosynthesis adenylyltransferase